LNPVSTLHGRVLTPSGWVRGDIAFGQRIVSINSDHADPRGDDEVPLILPGFIDLHVHGGAGVDIMQRGNTAQTVARAHARHGTTALLGTTMTAEAGDIVRALQGLSTAISQRDPGMARVLGVAFAIFLAWRKAPLIAVIIGAAVMTAALRYCGVP